MGNEFKGLASHSAEYFGDTRDYWWNGDFIRALAERWNGQHVRSVLDVGCGVGHWGRLLARALPEAARVVGVDRDPLWVEKAAEKAAAAGQGHRFTYQVSKAETLPFDDGTFDLVTCQTVLMHVRDPAAVLAEMIRVTKEGGLVITAEPTNIAPMVLDSIVLEDSPEVTAAILRFQLTCLRGKKGLGEGNDLLGESLPRLFAASGLRDIELRMNDRPAPILPPYASASERAFADEAIDSAEREVWIWRQDETRRYFLAGGGQETEFDELWRSAIAQRRRVADAVRANRYSCAGGGLFYIAWGRKKHNAG